MRRSTPSWVLATALAAAEDAAEQDYRRYTLDLLHHRVAGMNLDNFMVRPRRQLVERYLQREAWNALDALQLGELSDQLGPLPSEAAPLGCMSGDLPDSVDGPRSRRVHMTGWAAWAGRHRRQPPSSPPEASRVWFHSSPVPAMRAGDSGRSYPMGLRAPGEGDGARGTGAARPIPARTPVLHFSWPPRVVPFLPAHRGRTP